MIGSDNYARVRAGAGVTGLGEELGKAGVQHRLRVVIIRNFVATVWKRTSRLNMDDTVELRLCSIDDGTPEEYVRRGTLKQTHRCASENTAEKW